MAARAKAKKPRESCFFFIFLSTFSVMFYFPSHPLSIVCAATSDLRNTFSRRECTSFVFLLFFKTPSGEWGKRPTVPLCQEEKNVSLSNSPIPTAAECRKGTNQWNELCLFLLPLQPEPKQTTIDDYKYNNIKKRPRWVWGLCSLSMSMTSIGLNWIALTPIRSVEMEIDVCATGSSLVLLNRNVSTNKQ